MTIMYASSANLSPPKRKQIVQILNAVLGRRERGHPFKGHLSMGDQIRSRSLSTYLMTEILTDVHFNKTHKCIFWVKMYAAHA
jgi:hypothetical protein